MLHKLILLAIAGSIGTLARYAAAGAVQDALASLFPWGTAVVNLLGCFLAGAFWSLAENRLQISGELRTVLLVGFMGGFTTFSSYMLETSGLLRDAQWGWALANIGFQNIAGLSLVFLGLAVGRLI